MDNTPTVKRWQDWGNLILGAWLFISPWVLRYTAETSAARNAYIMGAAIVLFSAIAVYVPRAWEEAINTLLGLWVLISPWALRFASERNITANMVIVGILVMAFAVWAMVHDSGFEKWRHERHMTPRG